MVCEWSAVKYSRRQVLRAFALGGGLIAGELWIPGATKIFLPSKLQIGDELPIPLNAIFQQTLLRNARVRAPYFVGLDVGRWPDHSGTITWMRR